MKTIILENGKWKKSKCKFGSWCVFGSSCEFGEYCKGLEK